MRRIYEGHRAERSRQAQAAYRSANLDKSRASWRKSAKKRREEQAGRPKPDLCEVCDQPDTLRICFDHCHATGIFRGWLCNRCNLVLGKVKDDPNLLRKLAVYLEVPRDGLR